MADATTIAHLRDGIDAKLDSVGNLTFAIHGTEVATVGPGWVTPEQFEALSGAIIEGARYAIERDLKRQHEKWEDEHMRWKRDRLSANAEGMFMASMAIGRLNDELNALPERARAVAAE